MIHIRKVGKEQAAENLADNCRLSPPSVWTGGLNIEQVLFTWLDHGLWSKVLSFKKALKQIIVDFHLHQ